MLRFLRFTKSINLLTIVDPVFFDLGNRLFRVGGRDCAESLHSALRTPHSAFGTFRTPHVDNRRSSPHSITMLRVCNSHGGIFAIFLKIFFPRSKPLETRSFHQSIHSKTHFFAFFKIQRHCADTENLPRNNAEGVGSLSPRLWMDAACRAEAQRRRRRYLGKTSEIKSPTPR